MYCVNIVILFCLLIFKIKGFFGCINNIWLFVVFFILEIELLNVNWLIFVLFGLYLIIFGLIFIIIRNWLFFLGKIVYIGGFWFFLVLFFIDLILKVEISLMFICVLIIWFDINILNGILGLLVKFLLLKLIGVLLLDWELVLYL